MRWTRLGSQCSAKVESMFLTFWYLILVSPTPSYQQHALSHKYPSYEQCVKSGRKLARTRHVLFVCDNFVDE